MMGLQGNPEEQGDGGEWGVQVTRPALTVGGDVDFLGQLANIDLKAVLHVIQDLGVVLIGHKRDGQTLGAKPACSGHLEDDRGED